MPRTSTDGVEYAVSRKEAEQILSEFRAKIGFDRDWITDSTWSTTLDIACDQAQGIETAEKALVADMNDMRAASAKALRRTRISTKRDEVVQNAADEEGGENEYDEHVVAIFQQACGQYIDGGQIDMTYGKRLSAERYEDVRKHWTRLGRMAGRTAPTLFLRFESMAAEDKESKGKGGVGKTLDRRGVQGNMFMTVVTVRFNIHVDIDK